MPGGKPGQIQLGAWQEVIDVKRYMRWYGGERVAIYARNAKAADKALARLVSRSASLIIERGA